MTSIIDCIENNDEFFKCLEKELVDTVRKHPEYIKYLEESERFILYGDSSEAEPIGVLIA